MALDNANFISELSIVDPPGSDPLSQGDDQIRTIKRATQQSFPLIAAAVNITDVQMNLMAVKNEANIFSVTGNSFASTTILQGGASASPTLSFQQVAEVEWHIRQQLIAGDLDFRRFLVGVFQDVPMSLKQATGVVDFLNPPTVQGAPLWIAGEIRMFASVAVPGTNWFKCDGLNSTIDLIDRVMVGDGASSPGTLLNPNLVGQLSSGVSGATTLTAGQMPNHRHRIAEKSLSGGQVQPNPATVLAAGQGVAGVILSTGTQSYADQTADARAIIENTGNSESHTHTVSTVVTENGATRDTVRPLSAVVQYHQYVP